MPGGEVHPHFACMVIAAETHIIYNNGVTYPNA